MIQSLMQDVPLTLNLVHERVESLYAARTVTTGLPRALVSATYGEVLMQSDRLAAALAKWPCGLKRKLSS